MGGMLTADWWKLFLYGQEVAAECPNYYHRTCIQIIKKLLSINQLSHDDSQISFPRYQIILNSTAPFTRIYSTTQKLKKYQEHESFKDTGTTRRRNAL